ncbi:MAG: PQQ-dependent sugar dehydrogenase [Neptuniibacter sp.]
MKPNPQNSLPLYSFVFLIASLFGAVSYANESPQLTTETILAGFRHPWGMTWIDQNTLLITEKEGKGWIADVNSRKKQQIYGWPDSINSDGQGGLLDVVTDPMFTENKRLYFSFSHQESRNKFTTRVASAELKGNQLINWKVLFTALPYTNKVHHYGSRLAFKEGHLYITVGDRGERHRAQDLTDNAGKVHRINPDGSIPEDNPFLNKKTSSGATIPASIYSYGHRNPQGMYVDKNGQLWIHEHGPRGGDELNLVLKGQNYGWPIITYGREYWGPSIGEGTQKEGMLQPKYYYVPSIAPSGLIRYESDLFQQWKGDFLIGSLKKRHLNRLSLNFGESGSDEPVQEHRYLHHLDTRIRDIDVDKQGALYLLTDEYNGKLIKVTPK